MATVPYPIIKAKYATVHDQPVTIAHVGGRFYVIYDDGRIDDFAIEMAPFTVVLGDVALSDMQTLLDRIAGGAATIACQRQMEVR